jgi:transposase-like protein
MRSRSMLWVRFSSFSSIRTSRYHKGTNSYGNREILRLNIYPEESTNTWRDFLDSHKNRDLYGTLLVTSDAHGGIKVALQKKLPEAAR